MGSTGQETHSRRIQDLIRSARWPSVNPSASPSGAFGYLADTRTPKLTSIGIVADKAEDAFDYDNDSIMLKSGDNLTLNFADESVDNDNFILI